MMRPLAGICVVSLEQAVAAPFATRQLADLGARVIKIERPGEGDFARAYDAAVKGLCSHFVWLNRSKQSMTLDLKHPEAPRIMGALLERADVFMQNLAPGAADRLGLSAVSLAAHYPRLIVCDISGYGRDGPYGGKKAYDLLVQCETGVVSVTGTAEAPCKAGISVADIAAGLYAYSGVLTALYHRERTGESRSFEVTLFEALGEWMSFPAYYTAYGGTAPQRTGASHATIFPYGPFAAGDGESVILGIQNEREWHSFCTTVLLQPELAEDPRFFSNPARVAHQGPLREIILEVFSALRCEEIVARLDAAQIANGRVNSPQQFWDHAQLRARGRKCVIDSPAGQIEALLPPVTMQGCEPYMGPVPGVGEHSKAILAELGYTEAAIEQLAAERAI
jgi:itaconate CoA-transferase